jgi:hypothetical protein
MSPSIREPADEQPIDLGTGVDRRLLMAAAGLGLVAVAALVLVCVFAKTHAEPQNDAALAQRTGSPMRERAIPLPPLPKPQSRPQDNQPPDPPAVVAKAPAPPEKPKPLPTQDAVVAKPAPPPAAPVVNHPPAAPKSAEVARTPEPPSFKRIHPYSEEDLRWRLAQESREVDIETDKGTTEQLLDKPKKEPPPQGGEGRLIEEKQAPKGQAKTAPVIELVAQRADLKGLPIRNLKDCQASAEDAKKMDALSRPARRSINRIRASRRGDYEPAEAIDRELKTADYIREKMKGEEWADDAGVRMLVQMFQADGYRIRLQVAKNLAAMKGKSAGAALARTAAFDLDPEIREAAVEALKDRPRAESRSTLLEALRYPWPPVADHAAEALVALKDRKAVVDLARLLDEPDPRAPTQDKDNIWVKPELVRINHLANCILCHAPSSDRKDLVRGLVPERGKTIPVVYYESESGSFVRADVTYLKQDFSVMQSVPEPNKWPAMQRFDYLVRMRELTANEVSQLPATKAAEDANAPIYPQRVAVKWALSQLTGKDKGIHSSDWDECLKDARTTADP